MTINRAVVIGRDDDHSSSLLHALRTRRVEATHLVLGDTPSKYELHSDVAGCSISHTPSGVVVDDETIDSADVVFLIDMVLNRESLVDCPSELPDIASREWDEVVWSILRIWEDAGAHKWPLSCRSTDLAERKLFMLNVAYKCGAPIPASVITNRPDPLSVLGSAELVLKSLAAWQEISSGQYFNTTSVTMDQATAALERMAGTAVCMAQETIDREFELRVYVLYSEIIAVRLEAEDEMVDLRLASPSQLSAKTVNLPEPLAEILVKTTTSLGLNYCCFDVLVTAENEPWVTDVNPMGSWEYLLFNDIDISEMMVKIVERNAG